MCLSGVSDRPAAPNTPGRTLCYNGAVVLSIAENLGENYQTFHLVQLGAKIRSVSVKSVFKKRKKQSKEK